MLCRLSNPTATLYGYDANNTGHAIVLSLASPSASPADKVGDFPCTPDMPRHLHKKVDSVFQRLDSLEDGASALSLDVWTYCATTVKLVIEFCVHDSV